VQNIFVCVDRWRMEAETKMRAKGKGGMTDAEVVDFVDRYIPAYKVHLTMTMPTQRAVPHQCR
jgi:pantothenate kinase-related protein Tda10